MLVYLEPPQPSLGLDRIASALRRYLPAGVSETTDPNAANLTVIYAIGRRDHVQRQVAAILERGKQYAIVQVCLRSTMSPNTDDWWEIWDCAQVVWSYYDLIKATADDDGGDLIGSFPN